MALSTLTLPPHIHADILTGTDVVTGEQLAYPVIWADRITDTCPRCRQPVPAEVDCPVVLDPGAGQGGQLQAVSQQHGCGEWLPVAWVSLGDVDPADPDLAGRIEATARELAADRDAEIATETERLRRGLERDLIRALRHLGEPLDGDGPDDRIADVETGSETEPGVYLDHSSGAWVAWGYQPGGGPGDLATVEAETVTYAQAGSMLGVSRARVGALATEGKLQRGERGVTVASVLARMS